MSTTLTKNKLARNVFQEQISKRLLGPGSDVWGLHDDEEIISDYPLQRYYTGVVFPDKKPANSPDEQSSHEIENETKGVDEDIDEPTIIEPESDENNIETKDSLEEDEEVKANQNSYFPTNIGLTFCIKENIQTVDVEFSFGLYYIPKQTELKISLPEIGYQSFLKNPAFPFKTTLRYENGFMMLTEDLKGEKSGGKRSGDYSKYDEFRNSDSYKEDVTTKAYISYFEKLTRRAWKRKQVIVNKSISVKNDSEGIVIYEEDLHSKQKVCVKAFVKRYTLNNNVYLKIQLANFSTSQAGNRFTNKTQELNEKCLFQTQIKVKSEFFQPYKNFQELNPMDNEANILNFQYKKVASFGIGHNCSVTWNKENKTPNDISTTFIPQYDIKDVKNSFSEDDFENIEDYRILNDSLDIYNLSHFGKPKNDVISKLRKFVELYEKWIKKQILQNNVNTEQEKTIGNKIISKLNENVERLKKNIEFLNDDKIFKCFQLANTAMLIQIIISNDTEFAKEEKYLSQIPNALFNDLNFFKGYDFKRLDSNKQKEKRASYRPFQLAFILLNIDSIVDLNSKARNEIVDLIWFPTGGGKTEAYLAVAAFTILWRRLNNTKGFEGTTVIMRYTLRLLTAQQFERASRLIVALEFLRRNYPKDLKEEPISIGLWVGMASTPNTIEKAHDAYDRLNEECEKEKGDPESKNIFQISACPWCGTKLVNKNLHNGKWSIDSFVSNQKDFHIKCVNPKCAFCDSIPVQVIDEMLYENPPTLLFATVDKFAMLAWQEKGHNFFNSLNDNLPPDLIIQDELHLLSGPLGSITGMFESIIELLCIKGDKKPKIIASTATTRNTDSQIADLYGGRSVNIFPPSGLSYDDSFFAKESKYDSKRRYIAFMPTGKTAVDSQLRLLANLMVARMDIYKDKDLRDCLDHYWTIVSYYNSLKDVGKINNKVDDEISNFTTTLQKRIFGDNSSLTFNYFGLRGRTKELTSRISSNNIKHILKELENPFELKNIKEIIKERNSPDGTKKFPDSKYTTVSNVIDLVLATNMISVGIDISRLNVMLINSQPKNIAEYIQASSRVGRKYDGLVIVQLDANRSRDKSYFEHFMPFHQAFYKSVEPISLTPFTENTIDKMLTSIMVTYIRHKVVGCNRNNDVSNFDESNLKELKDFIKKRFPKNDYEFSIFSQRLDKLSKSWKHFIVDNPKNAKYKGGKNEQSLLKTPAEKDSLIDEWVAMQSMREVDTNTFIEIRDTKSPK